MNNYKFIYEKPRKYRVIFVLYLILTVLLVIISLSIKTYSKFKTYATILDNKIIIPIQVENGKVIKKSVFLKIDNKKYDFKVLEYSEIYNNGKINMQDIVIDSKINNKLNNQVFEVIFYYNYESMFKKIIEGVLK